jgi:cellulase (glycosyl hydrolase family 5)/fibronectin type III domain protein
MPEKATNLMIVAKTATSITLTWRLTGHITQPALFRVQHSVAPFTTWVIFPEITSLTRLTITGLRPDTLYQLQVLTSMGTSISQILQVTTTAAGVVPGPATALTLSAVTPTSLTLSWTAPTVGTTPFNYTPQFEVAGTTTWNSATVNQLGTSVIISGLTPGGQYNFQVLTTNTVGGPTPSTTVTQTMPLVVPSAPVLAGSPTMTPTSATLTWAQPAGTLPLTYAVGFRLTGTGSYVTGATTTSPGLTATISGLSSATIYDFEVTASNAAGPSPQSNIVTATTLPPIIVAPSVPLSLAVQTGTTTATLTWLAPATGTTPFTYNMLFRTTGTGTFVSGGTVTSPTLTGVITGLTAGTSYDFELTAANSAGTSPVAGPITAVTSTVTVAPSAPVLSSTVTTTTTTAALSWTTPATGTPPYNYVVALRVGTSGTFVTNTTVTTNSVTVTGLSASTTYNFEVTASNSAGSSSPSNIVSATTAVLIVAPSAPVLSSSVTVTASSATLTWAAPTTGTSPFSYALNFRTSGVGGYGLGATVSSPTVTATVSGLGSNTAYDFEVVATNSAGSSVPSNVVTKTTNSVAPSAPTLNSVTMSTTTATPAWTPPTIGSLPLTYTMDYRTSGSGLANRVVAPLAGTVTTGTWALSQRLTSFQNGPGGVSFQYNVLLPAQFSTSLVYPILFYGHENDEGMNGSTYPLDGNTFININQNTDTSTINQIFNNVAFRTAFPCIVVALQCDQTLDLSGANGNANFGGYGDTTNSGWNEQAVNALLQFFIAGSFPGVPASCIDPGRRYCTGDSLGAIGTLAWLVDNNQYNGVLKLWTAGMGFSDQLQRPGGTAISTVIANMAIVPYFAAGTTSDNDVGVFDEAAWTQYTGNTNYPTISTYTNGGMAAVRAANTQYYFVFTGSASPWTTFRFLNANGGGGTAAYTWLFSQVSTSAGTGSGTFASGGSVTSPAVSGTISGLTAATAYDFEIIPSNTAGTGPASNIVTASTGAVAVLPSAPQNLAATGETSSSISISWSPPATGTSFATTPLPMRTHDFIDTIGVNAPIPYTDGGYANITNVVSDMAYLGIHHIRSGISNGAGGSAPLTSFETIASAGIHFCAGSFAGGTQTTTTLAAMQTLWDTLNTANPGAIVLVEGPNEINNAPISWNGVGPNQQGAVNLQQSLYTLVHGDTNLAGAQVVMFTGYGFDSTYTGVGGINGPNPAVSAGYADYDNQHPYPQHGAQPGTWVARSATLTNESPPTGPAVYTEAGYTNNTTNTGQGWADQATTGKLIPNMLLDCALQGITRTYIYQLMDAYNTGSTQGNDMFGLFNMPSVGNTVPKPAATAIHNMTTILADAGGTASTFTTTEIAYSLSGMPSTGQVLAMQQSNGTSILAFWAEPQIWNSTTNTEITATPSVVGVALGATWATISIYDVTVGTTPVATVSNSSGTNITLTDHPILMVLTPPSVPIATAYNYTVQYRIGTGTQTSIGGISALTDTITGLQPSTTYTLDVFATGAAGSGPASATITATTSGTTTTVRSPFLQPGGNSGVSPWNTSIGTGAVFSTATSPDTVSLIGLINTVNAANFGQTIAVGTASDPLITFVSTETGNTTPNLTVTVHCPANTQISPPYPGGDNQITVMDTTASPPTEYCFGGCTYNNGSNVSGGITSQSGELNRICGSCADALTGNFGEDSGIGTIRAWELSATTNPSGRIRHVIRFACDASQLLPPTAWNVPINPNTGAIQIYWPQTHTDGNGPTTYTGHLPSGALIAIPSGTAQPSGLSAGGQMLFDCLKNYGAMWRDTAGGGVTFYTEPSQENNSLITGMRGDMATIVHLCRIVTNVGPNAIGGGGTPIDTNPAPPVDPGLCGATTVPGAPTGLATTGQGSTSIGLSWVTGTGSTPQNFLVQYSLTGTGSWTTAASGLTTNSTTVNGLTASTGYDFRVDATNAGGTGPFSTTLVNVATTAGGTTTTTLDPSTSTLALSGGNQVATQNASGAMQTARSTTGMTSTSGLRQFEATMNTSTSDWSVGIINQSYAFAQGAGLGGDGNGVGFYPVLNQSIYCGSGTAISSGASPSPNGEVVTVVFDPSVPQIWYSTATMRAAGHPWNNTTTANPATLTGGQSLAGLLTAGTYYACVNDDQIGGVFTMNFGATSFTVPLVTGALTWNGGGGVGAVSPGQVTGLAVNTPTGSTLAVTWNVPTGTPSFTYTVQQATASGGPFTTITTTGSQGITAGSLQPTTTYFFRVEATNSVGTGPFSTVGSASTTSVSSTAGLLTAGPLSTAGNQVVDVNAVNQGIACIDWGYGYNRPPTMFGLSTATYQQNLDSMKAEGYNCVRLHTCDAGTIAGDVLAVGSYSATLNPGLVGLTLLQCYGLFMDYGATIGMRFIVDSHTNEGNLANQGNGLWYDLGGASNGTDGSGHTGTVTDAIFLSTWQTRATAFASKPALLGYDIRNEPASYAGMCTWGGMNGATAGSNTDLRSMYQRVGDAIQAIDSRPLIFCEGPQNYTGSFLGGAVPIITNTSGGTITDGNGIVWSISSGGVIFKNGVSFGGANVIEMVIVAGVAWQENSSLNWFSYNGTTFVAGSNPTVGLTTVSCPDGDLTGVTSFPVVLTVPNKVVYSVHIFPNSVNNFGVGTDTGTTAITRWMAEFGNLFQTGVAPIWVGECGTVLTSGADISWSNTFTAFMNGSATGGITLSGTQQGPGFGWWLWSTQADATTAGTPQIATTTSYASGSLLASNGSIIKSLQFLASTTGGSSPLVVSPLSGTVTAGTWQLSQINGMYYWYLLPQGYSTAASYPLLVYLHQANLANAFYASGATGSGDSVQPQINPWFNNTTFRKAHPCIVVAPLLDMRSDTTGTVINWGGVTTAVQAGQADYIALTNYFILNYSVYSKKVYLTGNSMGGTGSWDGIIQYNSKNPLATKIFAAALNLAGADFNYNYPTPTATMVSNMTPVPVWSIHGATDTVVPPTWDRNMFAALSGTGSGVFTVSNGQVIGPDGVPFHPKGFNVYQGNNTVTSTGAPLTTLFPHVNFIRQATFDPLPSAATMAPFVNNMTANRIVVLIEHHVGAGGGVPPLTGSALAAENAWFASIATAFIGNPFVWFGTINEPSGPGSELSAQQLSNYNAIRGTGNNNIIVHQVLGVFSGNVVPFYTIGAGEGLISSTYTGQHNICWDLHFYNFLTNNSGNISYIKTQLLNLNSEAQTIQSADGIVPVFNFETGNSTSGETPLTNGAICVDAVCQASPGFAVWHWNSGEANNLDSITDGSGNLTAYGVQVAAYILTAPLIGASSGGGAMHYTEIAGVGNDVWDTNYVEPTSETYWSWLFSQNF